MKRILPISILLLVCGAGAFALDATDPALTGLITGVTGAIAASGAGPLGMLFAFLAGALPGLIKDVIAHYTGKATQQHTAAIIGAAANAALAGATAAAAKPGANAGSILTAAGEQAVEAGIGAVLTTGGPRPLAPGQAPWQGGGNKPGPAPVPTPPIQG